MSAIGRSDSEISANSLRMVSRSARGTFLSSEGPSASRELTPSKNAGDRWESRLSSWRLLWSRRVGSSPLGRGSSVALAGDLWESSGVSWSADPLGSAGPWLRLIASQPSAAAVMSAMAAPMSAIVFFRWWQRRRGGCDGQEGGGAALVSATAGFCARAGGVMDVWFVAVLEFASVGSSIAEEAHWTAAVLSSGTCCGGVLAG